MLQNFETFLSWISKQIFVLNYQALEILRCRYRQASNWASPQTALFERDSESKAESDCLENFYNSVSFLGSIVDELQILRQWQGQAVVKIDPCDVQQGPGMG